MPRDPQPNTHYRVELGVAYVEDEAHSGGARWTAQLVDDNGLALEQIGSATVGDTAARALDQLGELLVEHFTAHTKETP